MQLGTFGNVRTGQLGSLSWLQMQPQRIEWPAVMLPKNRSTYEI
jgi:hypothetical protein